MENLRQLRESKGLSQKDFADIMHASQNTVSQWENGKREPNFEIMQNIADYFNVSVDYLLGRKEKPKTKDEKEIEKIIENTISDLESSDGLMFDGVPANEEEIEQIKAAMRIGLAMAKEKARAKFTPHKHRKKKIDSQEENNAN